VSAAGEWVTVPEALAARHPLYGLDDGGALLVLGLLFGPLLLLAEFYGVVVPAVRSGLDGAEALWAWQTPFLVAAGLGWVLLLMLANHLRAVIWALPAWLVLALGVMLGLGLEAGVLGDAFPWDIAATAAVGLVACLYVAGAPRMRVTLRREVRRGELDRLRAAKPAG
jgi:hypothetical protein